MQHKLGFHFLASILVASGLYGCGGSSGNSASDSVSTNAVDDGLNTLESSNTAPVVDSVVFSVNRDNAHMVMLDAHDDEQEILSWELISPPLNGTITGNLPLVIYEPEVGFEGPDQFEVRVSDGELSSPVTTINLIVNNLFDSPTALSQSLSMVKNTTLPISLGFEGIDNGQLIYILESFPTHGRLAGNIPELSYIPDTDFEGLDRFEFSVGDGHSVSATASVEINVVYPSQPLNDTGVTWGANYPSGNNIDCIGDTIREQDCSSGRDQEADDSADGHAGFVFTKLNDSGEALPVSALSWQCVHDHTTGLIWEAKTDSDSTPGTQSLSDADDLFSWYLSDNSLNNGSPGYDNVIRSCSQYSSSDASSFCNTQAYAARANTAALCGYSDWRLPTREELDGLLKLDSDTTRIDQHFFPNTQNSEYWSDTPSAFNKGMAWTVSFASGEVAMRSRRNGYAVRLVREAD